MDALYARTLFDDLDLDARSQWISKGKKSVVHAFATKQTISIKLATTVALFYMTLTLTLQMFIYIWLVLFCFPFFSFFSFLMFYFFLCLL